MTNETNLTFSKNQLAYQQAAMKRWHQRQRREQDKREGITPAQRHIADALTEVRQPPVWAVQKREKELSGATLTKAIQAVLSNVVSLEAIRLQASIAKELQAAREARFKALAMGCKRPKQVGE